MNNLNYFTNTNTVNILYKQLYSILYQKKSLFTSEKD